MLRSMVEPAQSTAAATSVKGEIRIEEPSPRQHTIARRAAEARATVPDLEISAEVEMGGCVALQAEHGYSTTAILARACALALRAVPRANAAYRDGHFELYSRVNIGLAIATDDAYVTPTVFDADRKTLAELSQEIDVLRERAHTGELSPPELSGATFTLTDMGTYGVARSTTIITAPHAAAVAAGAIREVPIIRDGAIAPGHLITVTLASDHRILYGAEAASFLTRIQRLLEDATL
jgi:pyruvate dehydrogenase E2 component (dihydrolipoamide acetyltransferase)